LSTFYNKGLCITEGNRPKTETVHFKQIEHTKT